MASPMQITSEQLTTIITAYQGGATVREIAGVMHISASSVWKYLTRAGITMRSVGARKRLLEASA